MEIIIIVAIGAVGLWWFFLRDTDPVKSEPAAPYKVDTPPAPAEEVKVEALAVQPEPVAEVAPVVNAPAKKPRKPRAPKAEKAVAPKTSKAKKAPAAMTVKKARSKKA